jgi:hypothetical protein
MRSLAHRNAPSCPSPTYARVLSSSFVGDLVAALFAGAGFYAGVQFAKRSPDFEHLVTDEERRAFMLKRGLQGTVAGFATGLVPALAAQQGIMRTTGCPRPGMGAIFGYNVTRYGVNLGMSAVTRDAPKVFMPLAVLAGIFAFPELGKQIIRT